MGCFNSQKSDIALLIVTKGGLTAEIKRQYMDMAVRMNEQAPAKGIEFRVIREDYWDNIVRDIENAVEDIAETPMYSILNLCRVLANKREGLILSKQEGGEWGLANLPSRYVDLLHAALAEYRTGGAAGWERMPTGEYVGYMLAQIGA